MTNTGRTGLILTALVIAVIELGALYASIGEEPMNLVDGWGATRSPDGIAFMLALIGCGAVVGLGQYPRVATMIATLAYCLFILRDYEFGMTLPAMLAIFVLMMQGRQRSTAIVAAVICLASTFLWIAQRTATIDDGGVSTLVWVAFGTVSAVFFFAPAIVGELIRTRRQLRATENLATAG